MNLKGFLGYMQQRGYKTIGRSACGIEKGYPVTVNFKGSNIWEIVFPVDTANWKSLKKELSNDLKGIAGVTCVNNTITVNIGIKNESYLDKYNDAVTKTIGVLSRNGVTPPDSCGICKRNNCDSAVYYSGIYQPVHNNCCHVMTDETKQQAEKNDIHGNYFLGIIGAIIGAIVGCLPSVFSIMFTEKIYAILFALIPMCIYFGYKLLKGRLNAVALITTIVLTIVSVYLINIMLLLISLTTEYGTSIGNAFEYLGELLAQGESWTTMTKDSVMAFVFAAFGIWVSWGYITKTNQSTVQSVEAQMNTKVPYGNGNSDQPVM